MARIPQFTRTVLMDRSNPGNIESAGAIAGGNEAIALQQSSQRSYDNAKQANALLAQDMEQKAAEKRVNSATTANELQRQKITYLNDQKTARQANPTGFADEFDAWQVKQVADFEASLKQGGGKDVDLDYLRQVMDRDRTQTLQENKSWETGRRVTNTFTNTEQNIQGMNVNFMMSNPSWKDFVSYQSSLKEYVKDVGGKVLAPEDQIKLYEYGVDNAANSFFDAQLQSNPQGVKRMLDYGKGGQDAVIDFVMNDIEGGGRYVNDGGGKAKFGINSEANPDIDVKNLTAEEAVKTYKSRYWDKRLDTMQPAFQAVAFDALVNHGNDPDTWKMIDAANQNPQALIGLRQKEYARLVAANPEKYAKNQPGWDRRLKTLNDFANDLQGGGSDFLQNASLINPSVIESVKKRIPQAIKDQEIAFEHAQIKAREADITTKISNEDNLMNDVIYNESIPLKERIEEIRKNDLAGNIRKEFASESVAYLSSKASAEANVPPEQKFAAFNELTEELGQIRVKLGGTVDKAEDVTINAETMGEYQKFQVNVMKRLRAGEISPSEAKAFTKDFSKSIMTAISENNSGGGIARALPGVQDPYGYAFDYIDKALKNTGQEKNIALKKEMVMRFYGLSKNYESSLNTGKDEQVLNSMLKQTMQGINQKNFAGIIPPDKNPNAYVKSIPDVKPQHVFASEAELDAAGLPDGTPVVVGGVKGFARK